MTAKDPAKKATTTGRATRGTRKAGPQLGQELTPRERRCAALLGLGYNDNKIGRNMGAPFGAITAATVKEDLKSACIKLGVGRNGLVIWVMDNLSDTQRVIQTAAAVRRRDQLRASGVLTPQRVQIAMLYSDPEHCDKTQAEIGAMVTPKPITGPGIVSNLVSEMTANIGPDGCLAKLIAVLRLAPLSPRTTTDADELPPETL